MNCIICTMKSKILFVWTFMVSRKMCLLIILLKKIRSNIGDKKEN